MIDNRPWFVGKDVALALGYTNPNKAMGDHCKGVTKRYPLQTIGGMQELRIIINHDRRFLGEKEIASKLRRHPVRCWVFLRHVDGEKRHGR